MRIPQELPGIRLPKGFSRPVDTCHCESPLTTPSSLLCVACGRYPWASLKTIAEGYVEGHKTPAPLTATDVIAMLLFEVDRRAASNPVEGDVER